MVLLIPMINAEASSNPNLYVSAENSQFNNHFSGSMVIEVVIRDSNLHDTDEGKANHPLTQPSSLEEERELSEQKLCTCDISPLSSCPAGVKQDSFSHKLTAR